jgi:hypothetical protein
VGAHPSSREAASAGTCLDVAADVDNRLSGDALSILCTESFYVSKLVDDGIGAHSPDAGTGDTEGRHVGDVSHRVDRGLQDHPTKARSACGRTGAKTPHS